VTIHKRRGSGTWWAWLYVALILTVVAAAFAIGFAELK
jgi:hypothetical protein